MTQSLDASECEVTQPDSNFGGWMKYKVGQPQGSAISEFNRVTISKNKEKKHYLKI